LYTTDLLALEALEASEKGRTPRARARWDVVYERVRNGTGSTEMRTKHISIDLQSLLFHINIDFRGQRKGAG